MRLSKTTAAEIIAGLRHHRRMDGAAIEPFLTGPLAQQKAAYEFVDWCAASGKTFGPANIHERFAEFRAAPRVTPRPVSMEPFNDAADVDFRGTLKPGREHAGFILSDAAGGTVKMLHRRAGESLEACRQRAAAELEPRDA